MSVWIVETLIATTLLMALAMMLRRPVARWLGAGAAYALWLLPLARLLLPPLPEKVTSASPLHAAVDEAGLPTLLTPVPDIVRPSLPWLEIAASLWLLGFVLFLLVQLIGYARFRRFIMRNAMLLWEEGRIRIVASPQAGGPLAFGVFRPVIVLPVDFSRRFDAEEQEMAIAHERAHHARGDLAANMVALLVLGLHWCNPLAWLAYRSYRIDQEQACDARVLALYGQDQAQAYGRAILKAASGRPFAAACHLNRLSALKGRLKMLSNHDISLRRISWGMAAVALLTVSGLVLTASGGRAVRQVAALTQEVDALDFDRLSGLVAQSASAHEMASETVPVPPSPPEHPAPPAAPVSFTAPEPPLPPAPPLPPVPPPAPVAGLAGRSIPTEAEINRRIPHVDIANGCEDGRNVSRRETVDGDGRRHIRIRICEEEIEAKARQAARAGLLAARAQVAAAARMSDRIKADVLRDLDREIAQVDGEE